MGAKKLPCVWEVNTPYSEVLAGIINDEVFAASLAKMRAKDAPDYLSIYLNPEEFFEKTYVTETLKNLIRDIAEKLNGHHPEFNSVYKLETSFGGGKTHCLIALFHTFSGKQITSATFKEIVSTLTLPTNVKVVTLDGDEFNPQTGDAREEGVIVKTFWGDLAYQLGGKSGYDLMRKNDETLTSPGSKTLETLMGNDPVLVLIDEPAVYYSRAEAVVVGGTTLAKQTNTFLFDLISAISKKPNAVLVITLASSKDAFAQFTADINSVLQEADSIVARKARPVYPTKENEIYGVVRRRLFQSWNENVGKAVVEEYFNLYKNCDDLHAQFKTPDYKKKMLLAYPFHPELLEVLENRVASISTFQRTRGALRLLARVIADVWKRKEIDAHLIMPAVVALDNQLIKNELTGKLNKNELLPAIQADIANDNLDAKSQKWDQEYIDKKLPPLVSRVSNAVYLYTLIIGKEKRGIDGNTLLGSVLTPGLNPSTILNLLKKMEDAFWYFLQTNGLYYFNSEPTINKIIQDYMGLVAPAQIRARIKATLEQSFKQGDIFKINFQPSGPSEVLDDDNLKLLLLDYKTTSVDSKEEPAPNIIRQICDYGKENKPRVYKNTVFFLVGDHNQISRMEDIARQYEAYLKINQDRDFLAHLSNEQRDKIISNKNQNEQDLSIAVANVYRFLYYPKGTSMEVAELNPAAIGESEKKRQEIISDLLKAEKKITKKIQADYVISKAWPTHIKEVTTQELKDWFYQKLNLPIPTQLNVIKDTIKEGIKQKKWVYLSGTKCYLSTDSLSESEIKITKDAKLVLFEEAKRLKLCNEEGGRCPKCEAWPCECKPEPVPEPLGEGGDVTGEGEGGKGKPTKGKGQKKPPAPPKTKRYTFQTGMGLPEIIIKEFEENFDEQKPDSIQELKLRCTSVVSAKALITLITHFPESKNIIVDMTLEKTDETPTSIKKITASLSGSLDNYRDFFNGMTTFIQNMKLKPNVTVTIELNNKPKSTLDGFLTNLKNYNTTEFDLQVEGQILPK